MKNRKGVLTRLRYEQRGVTTVVVVASLIGIMAAVVLSLDFGSAWASRRVVITATDSTALHEGRVAALTGAGCQPGIDGYQNFLRRNISNADIRFENCELHEDVAHPGTGYILVEARKSANAPLGGIFGIGDTQPYSLSAVEYGFAKPEGLRPMSFCLDNAHVLQWIWYQNWRIAQGEIDGTVDPNFGQMTSTTYDALKGTLDAGHPPVKGTNWHYPYVSGDTVLYQPPVDLKIDYPQGSATNGLGGTSYLSYGVVHRMFFTKDAAYESGTCGGSSGNWGWIDLDGASNGTSIQNEWVTNGYDGNIATNDCNNDGVTGDPCEGDPGSSGGSAAQELQGLVDNQTQFHIPIFTSAVSNGSNADFTIWGFLPLILRGFKDNGPEDSRYFDFEFKDVITTGACCSKTGGIGTPKGIRICAVDHDGDTTDAIIRARCGQ
ncbi:MAG: Tad domain-containing protein [Actinomycetota bacterium]